MAYKNLDKSPARLAMEIRGKDRTYGEKHLIKFGASVSGAVSAVNMCLDPKSLTIEGTIGHIGYCIETNC